MPSSYPGGLDSYPTNRSDSTPLATTHAGDHNDLNDALNKIEAELGINPSGPSLTVAARVAGMETQLAGGAAYPASYYTGPLGTSNILPTDPNGALLILWHDGETTTALKRAAIVQRATDCGRATFDCIGIHYGGIDTEIPGRGGSHLGSGAEAWAHGLGTGSIPVVSWTHNRFTKGTTNLCTMTEINNGLHDAIITEAANYWKGLGYRVMWRPFWELDGDWFPWSSRANATANDGFPNPGCTTGEWITAWQRCVGLVQAAGATKVGFFWCPTEGNSRSVATACYPGDAYVDWVGSDVYCQGVGGAQTSPLHGDWAEFWEIFNYTGHGTATVCKHDEFGPTKPFMVGETGCLYDSGTPTRKGDWYRNINANSFSKPDMPYLRGIEFFDSNNVAIDGYDWRVDRNQTYAQRVAHTVGSVDATTYNGFKAFAANALWNVGVIGGAS